MTDDGRKETVTPPPLPSTVDPNWRKTRSNKGGRPKGSLNRIKGTTIRMVIAKEAEQQRWFEAVVGQEEELSDSQWEALKTKVLMTTMKTPGPNASAALKAMSEMDKQRKELRMGSRARVEVTKADCKRRLQELDALEEWARAQGVSDTTKVGSEHPAEGKSGKDEP